MLNSLDLGDNTFHVNTNNYHQSHLFNSNPNITIPDYNNNTLVNNGSPCVTDGFYNDTSLDNSIDFSMSDPIGKTNRTIPMNITPENTLIHDSAEVVTQPSQTHQHYQLIPNEPQRNFSNIPHGLLNQNPAPYLSSSFTSNSCHQKPVRFGSTGSSLSSNILLSSSSSSFSSFSSNYSTESQLIKQQNIQQYNNNLHKNSNNTGYSSSRPSNNYQRPLTSALAPPPASSLAMHRSSLPIAFNSTRTLTDIVSLEQLSTNQYGSDHYNLNSHDSHVSTCDINNNNSNTSINLESLLQSKNTLNQSIKSENCIGSFNNQSTPFDVTSQPDISLEDFNLSTPTDLELPSGLITNEQTQQAQQFWNNEPNKNPEINKVQTTYNPMPSSYQNQYNPLISTGIHVGQQTLNNTQISMMIPTATGLFSRSNSQPDLTIKMEKPLLNSNSQNLNNNYCYYFNNNNNNSNNSTNEPNNNQVIDNTSNYNNSISMTTNDMLFNGAYAISNNTSNMSFNFAKPPKNLMRRHPSLCYKASMSECNENDEDYFADFNIIDYLNSTNSPNELSNYNTAQVNGTNNTNETITASSSNQNNSKDMNGLNLNSGIQANLNMSSSCSTGSGISSLNGGNLADDGLFLGTDALTDFLSSCGTLSDLFDDLPEIEDLMSLVTFESSASNQSTGPSITNFPSLNDLTQHPNKQKQSQNIQASSLKPLITKDCYPLSNYFDYCNTESSNHNQNDNDENALGDESSERTTRSAPPSPTQLKKRQRPTANLQWNKTWNKMNEYERSEAVDCLTKIINDEMGLREQLEIIRILNPDAKLKPTDKQFIIDLKIIDDDKFKRIKDIIKTYGLYSNDRTTNDNSSDCSANSCPQSYHLAKRELRIKRAQQRLKLKIKKDHRQIQKETKSGLFTKTEVVPLSKVLPEEDIEVDILS